VALAATNGPNLPNSSYGFDGNAHLVVGGGSITLYKIAQGFADLYNESASCATNDFNSNQVVGTPAPVAYPPAAGHEAFNQCTAGQGAYSGIATGGNFDSDNVSVAPATGSSSGIASLNGNSSGTGGTFAYEGASPNIATFGDGNHLTAGPVNQTDAAASFAAGPTNTFTDASATVADVGTEVSSAVAGFPTFATVTSVAAGTVTMSANFTGAATAGVSVTYYSPGAQESSGFGSVDFAFSSRAAKTSGGNCAGGDEYACDTFWGVAADGVQVMTFDGTDHAFDAATTGFTANDLAAIFNCNVTTWGALYTMDPNLNTLAANLPPASAPIVPWSMNSHSGTYADFNTYVQNNTSPKQTTFAVDTKATLYGPLTSNNPTPTTAGDCVREVNTANNALPEENDIKPLLDDVASNYTGGVDTVDVNSTNNPNNWFWFGSFGLLSAYPFLSNPALTINATTSGGTSVQKVSYLSAPVPITGILPSGSNIGAGTYPIGRTLSVVTKKTDADCPVVAGACNFANTHTDTGLTLTTGQTSFIDNSATSADVNVEVTGTGIPVPATVLSVTGTNPNITVTISGAIGASPGTSVTFAQGPLNDNGQLDMNVLGATAGKGGAVREFVRFLCRTKKESAGGNLPAGLLSPTDPYQAGLGNVGVPENTAIGNVITSSGFTSPPTVSPGSNCLVLSVG
jgi:hypothetical protein